MPDPLKEHEQKLVEKVERRANLLQGLKFGILKLGEVVDQIDEKGNVAQPGVFDYEVMKVMIEEYNRILKTPVTSKSDDIHIGDE